MRVTFDRMLLHLKACGTWRPAMTQSRTYTLASCLYTSLYNLCSDSESWGACCCLYCAAATVSLLCAAAGTCLMVTSQGLRMLNAVGYGVPGSGLVLDLVYNPGGAFLAPAQAKLQPAYKGELKV